MRTGTRRHHRAIVLCSGLLMLVGMRGETDFPSVEAAHTPGQTANVCHGFVVLPTGFAVLSGIPAVPERAPVRAMLDQEPAGNAMREQGAVMPPIVMDGAVEIAMTYTLFRRTWSPEDRQPEPPILAHLELLIDRQGYIRARWIPRAQQGWEEMGPFLATIEDLNHEKPETAEPEEHLH